MSISISPQIKALALVGVLLIAVAGGYRYVLHRHATEPIAIPSPAHTKPAATKQHESSGAKTLARRHSVSPGVRSAAESSASHVHVNRVNPLLPSPLRSALAGHRIVVVSLWDPQAPVDELSVAEARSGAADAHVGFVVVDVLDNKVAGPLTALLPTGDMLPDPGVLVYRAPGKLLYRFDGFLDRNSVAQAAANAAAGLDTAPAAESTLP